MRRTAIAIALGAATPAFAANDSITIEATDGFRFLRCVDAPGAAACEYVAAGEGVIRCIALDADGQPLAAQTAFASGARVYFEDIDAGQVAAVICE